MLDKAKQLNSEEVDKVSGGSHVSASEIWRFEKCHMDFSYGPFGIKGPYPVYINKVNGTFVNMSFLESSKMPSKEYLDMKCKAWGWRETGYLTYEFDYSGDETWLE